MLEPNRIPNVESMVTLAAIQTDPRIGCKDDNVKKTLAMIHEAADKGANFLVLPEMANTGYGFNSREEVRGMMEPVPSGPTTQAWMKAAKDRKVYICAGIGELDPDGFRCYNSAVLIGPDGFIGLYRKQHLWCDDKFFFEQGALGFPVFETPFGKVAMLICYDMWFPEVFRIYARKGADLICCPTNWVSLPAGHPAAEVVNHGVQMCMVNATMNNVFIVAADRIGCERGLPFPGRSVIMGPEGWYRTKIASDDKEEIIYATVNLMEARRLNWNEMNVVHRDRRTDLYDDMLGSGEIPLPR